MENNNLQQLPTDCHVKVEEENKEDNNNLILSTINSDELVEFDKNIINENNNNDNNNNTPQTKKLHNYRDIAGANCKYGNFFVRKNKINGLNYLSSSPPFNKNFVNPIKFMAFHTNNY